MALKTKPFEGEKYFTSPEDQVGLLNDAFESGDPGYIVNAIGTVAKARGMTNIADELGVSRTSLYASLKEDGNPGFSTIYRVLAALGLGMAVKERQPEHA